MKTLLAAAIISLAGCATTPTPTGETTPGKTLIEADFLRPSAERGVVLVKRDRGMVGNVCTQTLFLDGRAFAELREGQRVVIYPTAQRHILSVTNLSPLCGGGGTAEIAIDPKPGQQLAYRTSIDGGASLVLQPTAF